MSQLPQGWYITEIKTILKKQSDGKLIHQGWSPRCHVEPAGDDQWGVLKTTAIQDGYFLEEHNKKLPQDKEPKERIEVHNGDLLMTNAGPRKRCGVTTFVKEVRQKLMLSGKMYRMKFDETKVYPKYIESYLRTQEAQKEIDQRKTGMSESGLNLTQQRFLSVPMVMCPFDEQKRIADKLDSVLAKVETAQARLDKIPTLLKRFRQSVLAAATSGELTKDWREENGVTSPTIDLIEEYWKEEFSKQKRKLKSYPYQNSGLNNIGWLNTTLGVICDVHIGSTPKRTEPSYWGGDVKWVSSSEVAFCEIYDTKEKITSDGLGNTSTKIHPSGTVMLAMIGQGKTRGQPAILRTEACHNQNTAALRVSEPFLLPEYLYYLLSERYEETRKIGGGNNQKALNKAVVQSIEIDLPSIEEQQEIVRVVIELFSNADLVEKQYKAAKVRLDKLTQSILAKAFRGELLGTTDQQIESELKQSMIEPVLR